jgi:hypothetical protein
VHDASTKPAVTKQAIARDPTPDKARTTLALAVLSVSVP